MSFFKFIGISSNGTGPNRDRETDGAVRGDPLVSSEVAHLVYSMRVGIIVASIGGVLALTSGSRSSSLSQGAVVGGLSFLLFWNMPVFTGSRQEIPDVPDNWTSPRSAAFVAPAARPAPAAAAPLAPAPPAAAAPNKSVRISALPRASNADTYSSLRAPFVDETYVGSTVGGGGRVRPLPPTTAAEAAKRVLAAKYKYEISQQNLTGATRDLAKATAGVKKCSDAIRFSPDAADLTGQLHDLDTAQMVESVAKFELEQARATFVAATTDYESALGARTALKCLPSARLAAASATACAAPPEAKPCCLKKAEKVYRAVPAPAPAPKPRAAPPAADQHPPRRRSHHTRGKNNQ